MKNYPRVLIMIETFNRRSGGGITLSNLFQGWDPSCLANAVTIHNVGKIENPERCDNYYCLGNEEFKVSKPLGIYFRISPSGEIDFSQRKTSQITRGKLKTTINSLLSAPVNWIKDFFNLPNLVYSMDVSPRFLKWIKDFNPDYIYIQPSSRMTINFFKKLHKATGVPLVMHIMDDWQNATIKYSFLNNYWKRKIDKEFRELLGMTYRCLSISAGMSDEYFRRYNKKFTHFHNTIEVDHWLKYSKTDFKIGNAIRILYAGRIGIGTYNSFFDLVLAIEELNKEGNSISLHIQSFAVEEKFKNGLKRFKFVTFNEFAEYSKLPEIFSAYDILLLPIDFEGNGKAYLHYSMPTKVSEFMISGTPILLFCPPGTALYEHAKKYNWAYTISNNDRQKIKKGILELIGDEDLRIKISGTAKEYALEHFNGNVVRVNFREVFK